VSSRVVEHAPAVDGSRADATPRSGVAVVARGVTQQYRRPDGSDLTVLDHLDLTIAPGERIAIEGRSGAGKSSLLALLGGLEPVHDGTLHVGDVDLAQLRSDDLAAYRRDTVGFVFQHFALLDTLTALENVELAMSVAAVGRARRRRAARALLGDVGLADRADHLPGALSGGERQRVAVARAVANEPRLLLADEPSGNLDPESTELVLELLDTVTRSLGCTFVVVTHDDAVSDRVERRLRLDEGVLVPA
jgi:ABC-type lipoprotein export system ATPase subunit